LTPRLPWPGASTQHRSLVLISNLRYQELCHYIGANGQQGECRLTFCSAGMLLLRVPFCATGSTGPRLGPGPGRTLADRATRSVHLRVHPGDLFFLQVAEPELSWFQVLCSLVQVGWSSARSGTETSRHVPLVCAPCWTRTRVRNPQALARRRPCSATSQEGLGAVLPVGAARGRWRGS
jgi:hypothetical protein